MKREIQVGDIVKLAEGRYEAGEESSRYTVLHIEKGRADIRFICDLPIAPIETVLVTDIEPV